MTTEHPEPLSSIVERLRDHRTYTIPAKLLTDAADTIDSRDAEIAALREERDENVTLEADLVHSENARARQEARAEAAEAALAEAVGLLRSAILVAEEVSVGTVGQGAIDRLKEKIAALLSGPAETPEGTQ